jgi:hypothetical protein
MVKPRSAMTESPGSSKSKIPHCTVSSLSDTLPPNSLLIKQRSTLGPRGVRWVVWWTATLRIAAFWYCRKISCRSRWWWRKYRALGRCTGSTATPCQGMRPTYPNPRGPGWPTSWYWPWHHSWCQCLQTMIESLLWSANYFFNLNLLACGSGGDCSEFRSIPYDTNCSRWSDTHYGFQGIMVFVWAEGQLLCHWAWWLLDVYLSSINDAVSRGIVFSETPWHQLVHMLSCWPQGNFFKFNIEKVDPCYA